jgi:multisubunit Na+/H+ antiporter MnhB subunit
MVQTAYHQGILSLLIGLGLPGLLTGLSFLFTFCLRHYRFAMESSKQPEPQTSLRKIHYAFFVLILVHAISFTFIYGDTFVSFPDIFFYAAIAEGLLRNIQNETIHTD